MYLKKCIVTAVAVLLLVSTCTTSCGSAQQNGKGSLGEWFDKAGFVENMDEDAYLGLLDDITFDEKKITEIAPYVGFGSYGNGGFSASCSDFKYGYEYAQGSPSVIVYYLSYSVEIRGFELPYQIKPGDGLEGVTQAFGYTDLDYSSFAEQSKNTGMLLLKSDGAERIVLRDRSVNDAQTTYLYPIELIYTEEYTLSHSGVQSAVKRSLCLAFSNGPSPTLRQVTVTVSEEY